jgi:ribonuclease D
MKLITTASELAEYCAEWAEAEYLTVDTEFIRESTYWPQLCLLQVGGPNGAVAVDPLSPEMDLAPFNEILANPGVMKVFHAGRQDIEIFFNLTKTIPAPIFDTQVAAMVCGFGDSVSYETLTAKLAHARLDKGSRFTDWAQRPLSERQLTYALDDVIHLRVIYEKLVDDLARTGRHDWVQEEMGILTNPLTYRTEPAEAWRRLKPRNDSPRTLVVLQATAAWRETEAQAKDVPRGRIMRDETLIELALAAPTSPQELARLRGLPGGLAEGKRGEALLKIIAEALAQPRDRWPRAEPRPDLGGGLGPTVELLKVLLRLCAEKHEVAAKLLASSSDLDLLAADDAADIKALSGWRYEIFGQQALKLKHGQLALSIENRQIVVKELTA